MPTMNKPWIAAVLAAVVCLLAGCDGVQSALAPAGRGAERIAALFWWMAAGATLIWLAFMALVLRASFSRDHWLSDRRARQVILVGGAILPTLVLTVLLVFGLALLPQLLASAPEGSLRVEVRGAQWWWRVRYPLDDGGAVELANEIRLPVGEAVQFELQSEDVIHAFWIPSLGGKVDMIPGRQTRLVLEPLRTGVFRGVCAEYCGTAHAKMSFDVVVMERDDFAQWLDWQRQPAKPPADPLAARGEQLFLASGCGACHAVRGSEAAGAVGPDLTHVGSRLTLAAGTLANDREAFLEWLTQPKQFKPAVHMPAFGMLPREDLEALAAYLEGLE